MRTRKLRALLRARYGQIPDPHYFPGDLEYIRAYCDYRRDNKLDRFLLDDITWHDLDMDRVFQRINPSRSTSGEQYLYYMLRSPALDGETYARRRDLIRLAESDPDLRLDAEVILARLGCTRRADLCRAFAPASHGRGMLLVYLSLLLLLLLALASIPLFGAPGAAAAVGMLVLNATLHELLKRRVERDLDTVNYTVSMVFAMRRLRRLRSAALDEHMAPAYAALDRLRSVIRTGGVSLAGPDVQDVFTTFTLLDLIAYEFLKNKLGRCHEEVFTIHEHLGRLDAAIAVASYRRSVAFCAEPALRFDGRLCPVRVTGMVHPLLDAPVPNDWITERPMLITGSNASGKSTYLKCAALAAILSQSICTCLARSYEAAACRIYSSMALSDDLLAGESYYIVETKSLKRILDSTEAPGPVLCVIDEVLRGTNTVERIAASGEILRALAARGALCLAATHDVELCGLLGDWYDLYHFEEQVGENEMLFDYTLRGGRATSRNAIDLLRLLGFDHRIVERAHERANDYLETGAWRTRP